MPRNNAHWQYEDYRQRMTSKEWQDLLLNGEDSVIFHGRLRKLIANKIGPNVWEVYKEPLIEEAHHA